MKHIFLLLGLLFTAELFASDQVSYVCKSDSIHFSTRSHYNHQEKVGTKIRFYDGEKSISNLSARVYSNDKNTLNFINNDYQVQISFKHCEKKNNHEKICQGKIILNEYKATVNVECIVEIPDTPAKGNARP